MKIFIFITFLSVALTLNSVSCQEADYEDEDANDGSPQDVVVSSSAATIVKSTTAKAEEDEEEENFPEVPDLPFAAEGESLSKIQSFLLSSVENVLKQALPTIVRSGLETNVSSSCSASFVSIMNALRESQLWAYRSKELLLISFPVFFVSGD